MIYSIQSILNAKTVKEANQAMSDFMKNTGCYISFSNLLAIVDDIEAVKQTLRDAVNSMREDASHSCQLCKHSRQAKVWLMCDQLHKRAPCSAHCNYFEMNADGYKYLSLLDEEGKAIDEIHSNEDLITYWNNHSRVFMGEAYAAILELLVNPQKLRIITMELISQKQQYYAECITQLQERLVELQ